MKGGKKQDWRTKYIPGACIIPGKVFGAVDNKKYQYHVGCAKECLEICLEVSVKSIEGV